MTQMDLFQVASQVNDEHSFLEFVAALVRDWENEREIERVNPAPPYEPGALGWENGSIGTYLDAAYQWAMASKDGLRSYVLPTNPWTRAAQILFAGKFYE